MPVQPTYPGVYVQEVSSGVRTITGVSTSIALFIGRATQGPLNEPIQCLSYTDFVRVFSSDTSLSDMPHYVKLFFMNGGTNCYVMRIAQGASQADTTLRSEAGGDQVLQLTAKQHGVIGETIRANVTYSGAQPENTFNIELFRWEVNNAGIKVAVDTESHLNLSMDPNSSRFAPDILTQDSNLVDAAIGGTLTGPINGYSQSGRPIEYDAVGADFDTRITPLIGNAGSANDFNISVDGNVPVAVSLADIDIATAGNLLADSVAVPVNSLAARIATRIRDAYTNAGVNGVDVLVSWVTGPTPVGAGVDTSVMLRISSRVNGSVYITPGGPADASVPLMLGTTQGGLEVASHAVNRPAPSGLTFNAITDWVSFADATQNSVTSISLDELDASGVLQPLSLTVDLITTAAADKMYTAAVGYSAANGDNDGIREKLAIIRDTVNDHQSSNPRTFFWRASLSGYRLSVYSTREGDNHLINPAPAAPALTNLINNTRYYSLGTSGTGGFQIAAGVMASDGFPPGQTEYDNAFTIVDNQVDLFNLMVLPPDKVSPLGSSLYGPASTFCQEQRAFLIMDAPTTWANSQQAASGVDALRVGLVNDHSAVYYPRLQINDDGRQVLVGASGAIAGLMARIDTSRGVWKAPAGTEATLRGITGLEYKFSDRENGVMNPNAVNTLRIFPNGIVSWGARTMDGDDDFASEWKYVPVRRTALFIEESLFRGLKWVVFEPNDEPLWAQIRLNVGAFMHNLFRQGAFQGATKKDAYFVKCDSETTTQNDINLGIVNIWVGFAPLKPAEFVILSLQQMTGQIEV